MMGIRFVLVAGDERSKRYIGVFGCRCEARDGREALKSEDLKEIGESGVSASPVMVIGKANREESDVKLLKASCSSEEAIIHMKIRYWQFYAQELLS